MFRCYVTSDELLESYPRLRDWIKREHIQTVINSSALSVVDDLRRKQIDASKIYIPLSISTDGVEIGNERRIVVDVTDAISGINISIAGSDDNATYTSVKCVDGSDMIYDIGDTGRYTKRISECYAYLKYTAIGTGAYSVYAVDTGFDQLIIMKTLINICLPIMGTSDDARSMFEQAVQIYDVQLANKFDYDRNADRSIDYTERNVNRMVRMVR